MVAEINPPYYDEDWEDARGAFINEIILKKTML